MEKSFKLEASHFLQLHPDSVLVFSFCRRGLVLHPHRVLQSFGVSMPFRAIRHQRNTHFHY